MVDMDVLLKNMNHAIHYTQSRMQVILEANHWESAEGY